SDAFTDLEKLVLRYAKAMTQTPVEVPDELFEGLRTHFNSQQLVELTSAIAWENFRARFDHAFGIEAEGFYEGVVCALPVGAGIGSRVQYTKSVAAGSPLAWRTSIAI